MGWRRVVILATAYVAAMVIAAIPAIGSFGSSFVVAKPEARDGFGEAAAGDHLQSVYRLWLPGHQLEHGDAPWRDPYSFQPLVEPQLNPAGWPFALAFWPLDAAFGAVVAWNLLVLLVGAGGGLATAAWLGRLGLPPEAAAIGGLAFAIAPYRLMQSGGHLLGLVAALLPVALWAFERCRGAEGNRARALFGALCALAIVSIPASGQVHLALGTVPFLAAYAGVRARRPAVAWAGLGLASAIAVGIVLRETVIEDSSASGGRSLSEVEYYSADWLDLLSRWTRRGLEQFAYLGWLTPALALAGLVLLWRRGRPSLALVLGLAVLVPVLLALGTNFPLYEPLRDVFPPLRFPRVPERLLPIAVLALAALAAVAIAALLERIPNRRHALTALAVVLIAADLLVFPLRGGDADPDNAAYAAVAETTEARILELPVLPRGLGHFGSVYLYYATQTPRERPTGYSTLAPESVHAFTARFRRLNCGVWRRSDAAELRRLGIEQIIFHAGVFDQAGLPGAWFAWRGLEDQGFRAGARDGPVFQLRRSSASQQDPPVPEPDRSQPVYCDGWNGNVTATLEAVVWMWGSGQAGIAVTAPDGVTVAIAVDGGPALGIDPSTPPTIVQLGPAGWHALEVTSSAPGVRVSPA
jgi:hypothetical protein